MNMKVSTLLLLLSSSSLSSFSDATTAGGVGSSLQGDNINDEKIDLFLDVLNESESAINSRLHQNRNTMACTPTAPFTYSSLSAEVIKEIEDNFNPTLFTFEMLHGEITDDNHNIQDMSEKDFLKATNGYLDYEKMPSFIKLYEEKCKGANGDLYLLSNFCDIAGFTVGFKKQPMCLQNCASSAVENYFESLSSTSTSQCDDISFEKKDMSSSTSIIASMQLIGVTIAAFLMMIAI